MKQAEFVKLLVEQGATFKQGSKHLKVYLNGKQSTIPRHPGKEIDKNLAKAIKRHLGLQ